LAISELIATDPQVLDGKPVVRGTRLSVEFILGLFAAGWTEHQVLASYPSLTVEALRAVFAYAAEVLARKSQVPVRPDA
jgi:uncharacterized protein (DUF433 family)